MHSSIEIAGSSKATNVDVGQHPTELVVFDQEEPKIMGLESWSPAALELHRGLALAGLSYRTKRGGHPPEVTELDSDEPLPLAAFRGELMYDAASGLSRVAELAPGRLEPAGERARAEAWLWHDWAVRSLGGFVLAARWADPKNWPLYRDVVFGAAPWFVRQFVVPRLRRGVLERLVLRDVVRDGMERLWGRYLTTLDHLERIAPRDGFWGGQDLPTVADLGIFARVRALRTHVTAWQSREIAKRPALVDWLDRVDDVTRSRPKIQLVLAA